MTKQQWVLVTGGSRGIGAACARLAAADGFAVAVNYRADEMAAADVVSAIRNDGGNAEPVKADVAKEAEINEMFAMFDGSTRPLAGVINSAGIGITTGRVDNFDAAGLDRLFRVNVIGTMLCCREAMKRMSIRHGGTGGAIVNISSMAATIGGRAGSSAYAASKAAIDSFTTGLAKEAGPQGVRVNAVRPGMTVTDMTASMSADPAAAAEIAATIPMNRMAHADEVARPAVWLLSDAASFVSGAFLDVSGGGFIVGKPIEH